MKNPRDAKALIPTLWNLADVTPYEHNARTHPPEQIELLAELMKEFGPDQAIVVDENAVILKGHGRRDAAIKAGIAEAYPVVQRTDLSEVEKEAMRLSDNQVALLSGWDTARINLAMNRIKLAGYPMERLGFPQAQLVQFMAMPPTGNDPEDTPEPQPVPITKRGDVWILGNHRIVCGDSTDEKDVKSALAGAKPVLMATDPPYGVNYDPAWREAMGIDWMGQVQRKSTHATAKSLKSRSLGKVENDDRSDWTDAWKLFKGEIAYVWCASLFNDVVIRSLESVGFVRRAQIIWNKQHFTFGRGDYHWKHEPCWYVVRKGGTAQWAGDRKQTTVWDIDNASAFKGTKDDVVTGHGTQKPIECMRRPIQNNSQAGDHVYEPFAGSGTTIIACEMMNRQCCAIELSPVYVDVCVRRWQTFAKGEATLENDGRTFAEISAERLGGKKNAKSGPGKPVRGKKPKPGGRRVPKVAK